MIGFHASVRSLKGSPPFGAGPTCAFHAPRSRPHPQVFPYTIARWASWVTCGPLIRLGALCDVPKGVGPVVPLSVAPSRGELFEAACYVWRFGLVGLGLWVGSLGSVLVLGGVASVSVCVRCVGRLVVSWFGVCSVVCSLVLGGVFWLRGGWLASFLGVDLSCRLCCCPCPCPFGFARVWAVRRSPSCVRCLFGVGSVLGGRVVRGRCGSARFGNFIR